MRLLTILDNLPQWWIDLFLGAIMLIGLGAICLYLVSG